MLFQHIRPRLDIRKFCPFRCSGLEVRTRCALYETCGILPGGFKILPLFQIVLVLISDLGMAGVPVVAPSSAVDSIKILHLRPAHIVSQVREEADYVSHVEPKEVDISSEFPQLVEEL